MAHFLRLIVALLAFSASAAFADFAPNEEVWRSPQVEGKPGFSSAEGACGSVVAMFNTLNMGSYSLVYAQETLPTRATANCKIQRIYNGNTSEQWGSAYRESYLICPENTNPAEGGQCQCATNYEENAEGNACVKKPEICEPGYVKVDGVCVPEDCKPDEVRVNGICVPEPPCPEGEERVNGKCVPKRCKKGENRGSYSMGDSDTTHYFCETDKCQVRARPTVCVSWDGKTECTGDGITTGASCDGGEGNGGQGEPGPGKDDGDPGNGDPGEGGPGQGDGPGDGEPGTGSGGNGGSGNPGSGPGTGPGTGPGKGDGPGQSPGNPDKPSKPGSSSGLPTPKPPVEPNENEECPEGYDKISARLCVEKPKPPDKDGTCPEGFAKAGGMCYPTWKPGDKNPGEGGEGDEDSDASSFGGTCVNGFTCEGDAIQCALAYELHKRNCKLFEEKSAESDLYFSEKDKTGNRTSELPGNETVDLNNRIDSVDALGGGGGVQDLSITVAGQSITLPLSVLNSPLAVLGNLLVAISFLLAFRIVGRG